MTQAAPNLVLLKDFLPPFKIGATVRLKSGGPRMTITAIQDGHVEARWFEGNTAKQGIYPFASVKGAARRRKSDEAMC